jgi:signal transduction histidine kinase
MYEEIGVHAPEWQDVSVKLKEIASDPRYGTISFDIRLDSLEIYADPMLGKIYENLIDNSVRHGEHVKNIGFSYEKLGNGIVVVYQDDGVGIPEPEKERIFEKGVGKNTGFGLFLTREILAITGLSIKENGISGRGARFEIIVPEGRFRSGSGTTI